MICNALFADQEGHFNVEDAMACRIRDSWLNKPEEEEKAKSNKRWCVTQSRACRGWKLRYRVEVKGYCTRDIGSPRSKAGEYLCHANVRPSYGHIRLMPRSSTPRAHICFLYVEGPCIPRRWHSDIHHRLHRSHFLLGYGFNLRQFGGIAGADRVGKPHRGNEKP